MPTPTYTPLANLTLSSSAASVTFSSISQAYRDLVLVASVKNSTASSSFRIRVNNSGTTTSSVRMRGSSSGASSESFGGIGAVTQITSSTGFSAIICNIMDYSATDKHKTILTRANIVDGDQVEATYTRWPDTAAVTSLVLNVEDYNLAAGTTLALYGIAA